MAKFICPECNHSFEMSRIKWILVAPFHMFTKRKTKCPKCGKKNWIKPVK